MFKNQGHSFFKNSGFKAQLSVNRTKNVRNQNHFVRFGLLMFEFQMPEIIQKWNVFVRILDASLELGQKLKVREPNVFRF